MNIYITPIQGVLKALNSQITFFCLTSQKQNDYISLALLKSVEPRNSNNISLAYNYTPLNACFFMRSTNTPKERLKKAYSSMVACYGKGFALCCVPVIAVFEPVTRYRPKASKLQAVTSKNLFTGATAMIYLFKTVSRLDLRNTKKPISAFPRYTVRIQADSIEQATAQVAPFFVILGVQNA